MNTPDPPHGSLNLCFSALRTICMHLGLLGCLTKLGAKRAELVQKFVPRSWSEFFTTNQLDPLHWTLNSYFRAFRTVWVHLRPFGSLTKLGAKHSELVQKFVRRSRVGVFHDERTRSTQLDPKLLFLCVFKVFGCIWQCFVTTGNMEQNRLNRYN